MNDQTETEQPNEAPISPSLLNGGLGGTSQVFGIIDPDYGRIFTIARLIAWQEGFSICAQGSFTRDLDLLAVPWTEHARPDIEILVRRIADASGLTIQGEPSSKPHGRKAWTLLFPKFGDPRFVDLSVMPPNVKLRGALQRVPLE